MSYSNLINKLSSETKKALDESTSIYRELQATKYGIKKYNKNSIGYKSIFEFEIDSEIRNNNYLVALEVILNYILEYQIFKNDCFITYTFYIHNTNLKLSLFHSDKKYLEKILNDNFIETINFQINSISNNIRNKFLDINSIPFKIKIKSLNKDYPILVDILCNILTEKKMINKSNEIVDCIIKLLFINDINIIQNSNLIFSTFKSEEEPINFLSQFYIEKKMEIKELPPAKKIKFNEDTLTNKMENVNSNIKQLFWHTMENMKPLKKKKGKSYWKHSIVFILILALTLYSLPNYIEKIFNYSKNSSVIDNILDIATDDLTNTNTNFRTNLFSKTVNKMDTIQENNTNTETLVESNEPNEPAEPNEPVEPNDDIGLITRNIIKNFDLNEPDNLDLKGIEKRLKLILEETSTNN